MNNSPSFQGMKLMGDSLLLQFAVKYADSIPDFEGLKESWGMCRVNQTADGLLRGEWPAGLFDSSALIMIGANDVLNISQNRDNNWITEKKNLVFTMYKLKVKALRKIGGILVFCTVPDIPWLDEDADETSRNRYKEILRAVNHEIKTMDNKHGIKVVDLQGVFHRECYERTIGIGEMYLNEEGMELLKNAVINRILLE